MIAALTGNLWRAAACALAGLCLALLVQIHGLPIVGGGLIASRDKAQALASAERAAHQITKDRYTAAQADAARAEAFRLARVRAEQERINASAQADYTRRLADARARYDRLRGQTSAAVGSASGGQPVPALPVPAFGTDAPTTDGLPAALSLDERMEATAQGLQLDALISWLEGQSQVSSNP